MSVPKVLRVNADGTVEKVENWTGGRYEIVESRCKECGSQMATRYYEAAYASDRNSRSGDGGVIVLIEKPQIA